MKVRLIEVASLINVIEYSDIETSIAELMETVCDTLKNTLLSEKKKKIGNWTWSVFSVNNKLIQQRAAGGLNSNLRKSVATREADTGMIAKVLSSNFLNDYLYEENVGALSEKQYFKVIDNTKSAFVYKITRQHDIVGVINIESDNESDFEEEITPDYLNYVSKILSSVLLIGQYKSILDRYEKMFNRTINVMKDHETISLQPFYKDITELFRVEYRLDAALMFICKNHSDIKLASTSNTSRLMPNTQLDKALYHNKKLLIEASYSNNYSPLSKNNIDIGDLLTFNKDFNNKKLKFVRLYNIRFDDQYSFILVAISHKQYNPPGYQEIKSFEKLLVSTLRAFVSLEKERIEKEKNILTNELYRLSYAEKNHSTFLENAVNLISKRIHGRSCVLVVYRKLEIPSHIKNDGLSKDIEIVSYIDSDYVNTIVNKEKLLKIIDRSVHNKITCSVENECLYYHRDNEIFIILEDDDTSSSGHKLALCVVNEQRAFDRICIELSNSNHEKYLQAILYELNKSLAVINNSLISSDTINGFSIIHENHRKIESARTFDELVEVLHNLYGTIYQTGSKKTLSAKLNILRGSYLAIYIVEDENIMMTRKSQKISELPDNPPTFKIGKGLTGKVVYKENKELFVPMVESNLKANIKCKSYWNKVLSTHARYFYGKVFEFGGKKGIITIVGERTSHFHEQIFATTIRSIFDVMVDIIHASGERFVDQSSQATWPEITRKIISDYGSKDRNVFLMIRYLDHDKYSLLRERIRIILKEHGLNLLIADEKMYNPNLNVNLEAYMDSSDYFIAVIDETPINPNISYEMGYMNKKSGNSLILKDVSINALSADFTQKLFEKVDLNKVENIDKIIHKWANSLNPRI